MTNSDKYIQLIKNWIRPLQRALTIETEGMFNNILGRKKYFNEYLNESFMNLDDL